MLNKQIMLPSVFEGYSHESLRTKVLEDGTLELYIFNYLHDFEYCTKKYYRMVFLALTEIVGWSKMYTTILPAVYADEKSKGRKAFAYYNRLIVNSQRKGKNL